MVIDTSACVALGLGDCFAYALTKTAGAPLLYKGGDFARTDVAAALRSCCSALAFRARLDKSGYPPHPHEAREFVTTAKNIAIAVDEELAREVRIEAARAGKSVSRFVAELLRDRIEKSQEKRSRQLEALQAFLSGPDLDLLDGLGRPLREQIWCEIMR